MHFWTNTYQQYRNIVLVVLCVCILFKFVAYVSNARIETAIS